MLSDVLNCSLGGLQRTSRRLTDRVPHSSGTRSGSCSVCFRKECRHLRMRHYQEHLGPEPLVVIQDQ